MVDGFLRKLKDACDRRAGERRTKNSILTPITKIQDVLRTQTTTVIPPMPDSSVMSAPPAKIPTATGRMRKG